MDDPARSGKGLPRLRAIMERLRDPERGCPWDVEQDFASIAPYTIEEAYEVADAIEREAWDELEGELGDLLLQVVYHAQMAREADLFDFDSVAERVAQKMWDRHPHVFGDESNAKSAQQQVADWEAAKAKERRGRTLDGVALGLPALMRAEKLQKRAARVGFDWGEAGPVLDKIAEEAAEVAQAATPEERQEEVGDLLFTVVNLARHLEVDPEAALRTANAKFQRRFDAVEDGLAAAGRRPREATLDEMDALWNAARAAEKAGQS
ncbi:nucleoside triphosphate pyrophosphohydrolase [Jannaschia aquimarina]|uniref:Nucleoside triphosphate pyrophosphohydrolase n=1 Tax=Jannaschia aquimarina TaxID=935700 RepID=A0A0D1EG61_9RHOB|nr:nucleoside triphosphate pyrophosphohydrolase [Jannaschia aquimarina]KIT15891.1 Nucleoside triphosphate pyrophosphohydrolase [Jannaschia aquimarina]SNS97146.1 ATP diphosphatase [Jannaschia aquimarina]